MSKLNQTIYIPKTLSVTFLKREGTMDGLLSFPSYLKKDGSVAHQKSIDGWVRYSDEKATTKEFSNKVMRGFLVNTSVSRSGNFNSNRSMIRIYSPDEFEFEISVDNFCYIMDYSDVSRKDIMTDMIIGFCAGKIVLIPTNSPAYKMAQEHTAMVDGELKKEDYMNSISSNLVPFNIYRRGHEEFLYLGEYASPKFKNTCISFKKIKHLRFDLNSYLKGGQKSLISNLSLGKDKQHIALNFFYKNNSKENFYYLNRISTLPKKSILKIDKNFSKRISAEDKEEFGEHNFVNNEICLKKIFNHTEYSSFFPGKYNFDENIQLIPLSEQKILDTNNDVVYEAIFSRNQMIYLFKGFDKDGNIILVTALFNNSEEYNLRVFKGHIKNGKINSKWETLKNISGNTVDGISSIKKFDKEAPFIEWKDNLYLDIDSFNQFFHPQNIEKNLKAINGVGEIFLSGIKNNATDTIEILSPDCSTILSDIIEKQYYPA